MDFVALDDGLTFVDWLIREVEVVFGEEEDDLVDAPEDELVRQEIELDLGVKRRAVALRVTFLAWFRSGRGGWREGEEGEREEALQSISGRERAVLPD